MLIGSFLGVVQDDLRRLLAYSGVAHAGFILTGVVAGRSGTGGVWFYLAVYAVQLVGAYAVVAAVSGPSSAGSALARYSGLGKRQPFLALGLTVLLLGMAGIPSDLGLHRQVRRVPGGLAGRFRLAGGGGGSGLGGVVLHLSEGDRRDVHG